MNLLNSFVDWFDHHPSVLITLGASSIFIFIFSIMGISWFIAQIPRDYFLSPKRQPSKWKKQAPLIRMFILVAKNIIGLCLILGGAMMLVLPGQGLLTMITGLLLINYPGKFRLEQKIVSVPSIFKALNWIRAKSKKPPLKNSFL